MRVVATAGHVDHGKSSLVLALTGTDPDRFPEEKERGLTIDLGFAFCTLPSGQVVGFVDVPGHVRFVKNMLAGAGAVDVALLVVAANEGWMPQTEEHMQILDLLDVRHGMVALTKAALVDDETRDLAQLEVAERTAWPVVVVVTIGAFALASSPTLSRCFRVAARVAVPAGSIVIVVSVVPLALASLPSLAGCFGVALRIASPAWPVVVISARGNEREGKVTSTSLAVRQPGGLNVGETVRCLRGMLNALLAVEPI